MHRHDMCAIMTYMWDSSPNADYFVCLNVTTADIYERTYDVEHCLSLCMRYVFEFKACSSTFSFLSKSCMKLTVLFIFISIHVIVDGRGKMFVCNGERWWMPRLHILSDHFYPCTSYFIPIVFLSLECLVCIISLTHVTLIICFAYLCIYFVLAGFPLWTPSSILSSTETEDGPRWTLACDLRHFMIIFVRLSPHFVGRRVFFCMPLRRFFFLLFCFVEFMRWQTCFACPVKFPFQLNDRIEFNHT
jgi:hypothetical protein